MNCDFLPSRPGRCRGPMPGAGLVARRSCTLAGPSHGAAAALTIMDLSIREPVLPFCCDHHRHNPVRASGALASSTGNDGRTASGGSLGNEYFCPGITKSGNSARASRMVRYRGRARSPPLGIPAELGASATAMNVAEVFRGRWSIPALHTCLLDPLPVLTTVSHGAAYRAG